MQDKYENHTVNRREKIKRAAVAFFTVMLILAFFSNTINHISLPRVDCERPSRGSIIKEVLMTGYIEANEIHHCYIPSGMRLLEIHTRVGEKVNKGQSLLKLDTETIKTQLVDALDRFEQKKIELAIRKLESDSFHLNEYDNAIESAQNQLQQVESDYNRIRMLYEAKCETQENYENARRKFSEAQRVQKKAVSDKENAILSNQIKMRKEEMEIKSLQIEIEIQKREIERMKEQLLLGELTAPFDGIITDIGFRKGEMTNASQPVYSMIDTSKGYCFTGLLDIDDAADLKPGDEAEISLNAFEWEKITGKVMKIKDSCENKGEKKEIVIEVSGDVLEEGQKGEARFYKKTKSFDVLVSNSAIGQDNTGYFVYVPEEKKSYLGNEIYIRAVHVTIGESDDKKIAVVHGLSSEDRVITASDKPLSDGMRVIYDR